MDIARDSKSSHRTVDIGYDGSGKHNNVYSFRP